jgi:hypothetical protein
MTARQRLRALRRDRDRLMRRNIELVLTVQVLEEELLARAAVRQVDEGHRARVN